MLRSILVALAATLSLASAQILAHEGHDHEDEALNEKQVARLAAKTLPTLVQSKKVDPAWAGAQREGIQSTLGSRQANLGRRLQEPGRQGRWWQAAISDLR